MEEEQNLVNVAVEYVKPGMYVAKLDKSWLDTPFPFQGFLVQDTKHIVQLQVHCDSVYIDPQNSAMSQAEIIMLSQKGAYATRRRTSTEWRPRHRKADRFSTNPLHFLHAILKGRRQIYEARTGIRDEAPRAIAAHDEARKKLREILGKTRLGDPITAVEMEAAVKPLISAVERNADMMGWLVFLRKRDGLMYNRAIASSVWAAILGRYLGYSQRGILDVAIGALLLDIGNAKLPWDFGAIEGKLDETEHLIMRSHVREGVYVLKSIAGVSDRTRDMVANHHERLDGSGYPNQLAGKEICEAAAIAGLVDTFDAMTTDRSYTIALSPYQAVRELNDMAGVAFRRDLVESFVQALGMFPTGGLVELNTGEIGIVIKQHSERRLRPMVLAILDKHGELLEKETVIDLSQRPESGSKRGAVWITCGHKYGEFDFDPLDYFG